MFQVWQEQRKFLVLALNNLGVGSKDSMETFIETEAEKLVESLEKMANKNEIFKVQHSFLKTTNSIIWKMVTGQTPGPEELEELTKIMIYGFKVRKCD